MTDEYSEKSHWDGVLGITALCLSVVALIIAAIGTYAMPERQGPQGPAGPQGPIGTAGPQGPAGTGSLLAVNVSTGITTIEATCTHYVGGTVTITVPSTGVVVVSTVVQLYIDHTYGIVDKWYVVNGIDASQCGTMSQAAVGHEPANADTDSEIRVSIFAQSTFSVSAGTFTFYVNGYMISGQDANDRFWYSNSVAVFYPS